MVINDFVSAMQSKDHEALAACFAEECRLFDYCPSVVKRQNSFLFGRNAIEMYYHNKFMFGGFGMLDPRVVNERTVNFYADYNGTIIHALAQIEAYAHTLAVVGGQMPASIVQRVRQHCVDHCLTRRAIVLAGEF